MAITIACVGSLTSKLAAPVVSVNITGTTTATVNWTAPTPTGQSVIAGYRVYRATASGGPYTLSGSVAAGVLTFPQTALTAATTYFWQVEAFDQFETGARNAPVSATTTSSVVTLRRQYGHYARMAPADTAATVNSRIAGLGSGVAGVVVLPYWKDFETSKGVYSWTFFDSVMAQALALGKSVIIRIQDRFFNDDDPLRAVPQYIYNEHLTYVRPNTRGAGAKVWGAGSGPDPTAMGYLIAAYQQIIGRYANHPALAAIAGEESAIGSGPLTDANGGAVVAYDETTHLLQEKNRATAMRTAAPAIPYILYTNFWTDASSSIMTQWFTFAAADGGIILNGGPDAICDASGSSGTTTGFDVLNGVIGPTDYRDTYPTLGSTEASDWGRGATPASIFGKLNGTYHVNYLTWLYSGGSGVTWAADIAPFIQTHPLTHNSGAFLVGTTLTINGSGLGSAPAAPIKDLTLAGVANGADMSTVFDGISEDATGQRALFKVDQASGLISGWGAMKHTWNSTGPETLGGNNFPQAYWDLSPGYQSLYVNYHIKIIRTSGPQVTQLSQIKNGRYGYSSGQMNIPTHATSGNRLYQVSGPKYFPDHYDGPVWQNEEPNYRSHGFAGSAFFADQGTHVDWLDDQWHCHESYMALNTLGQSNGKLRLWNDGQLRFANDAVTPRDQAGDVIDFLIPYPGFTNGYTNAAGGTRTYALYFSKIFVAQTPQTVLLINAATWAAATSRIPLSFASWNSAQIVCNNVLKPSGYNWVAVRQADGTTVQVFAI